MDISTPVFAALIGATVGGVISGVINIISLSIQYIMNEKHQKILIKRDWRRETTSILRELKRTVMRYEPSKDTDDLELINSLVDDIENQIALIPEDFEEKDLNSLLGDIVLANQRQGTDSYYDDKYEYRADLITKTEDALDTLNDQLE